MYDPELPNGCQDGDFEQAELERLGRLSASLRKKGICTHGYRQGLKDGREECLYCHKIASRKDLDEDFNQYR